jgi:hypothetical protein
MIAMISPVGTTPNSDGPAKPSLPVFCVSWSFVSFILSFKTSLSSRPKNCFFALVIKPVFLYKFKAIFNLSLKGDKNKPRNGPIIQACFSMYLAQYSNGLDAY